MSCSLYEPSITSHKPGIIVEVLNDKDRRIYFNKTEEWKTMHGRDLLFTIEFRNKRNAEKQVTMSEPSPYHDFMAPSEDMCASVSCHNVITRETVHYVPVMIPKSDHWKGMAWEPVPFEFTDNPAPTLNDDAKPSCEFVSLDYMPVRCHRQTIRRRRQGRGPMADYRHSRARMLVARNKRKEEK